MIFLFHNRFYLCGIPAKGVDFPSCEEVVKMIVKRFGVVFRCDMSPPFSRCSGL